MITKLSHIIAGFFIREEIFPEEQREIYEYGFELSISSVIGIIIVLAIGLISGKLLESVVFYIVFCFTRLYSGGYHAPTQLLCKITFAVVLLSVLALDWLLAEIVDYYWFILYIYSITIMCEFAPIENPNKKLDDSDKTQSKRKCIIEMAVWLIVMIILYILNNGLYHIVALSLFFVANLMLLEVHHEGRDRE